MYIGVCVLIAQGYLKFTTEPFPGSDAGIHAHRIQRSHDDWATSRDNRNGLTSKRVREFERKFAELLGIDTRGQT